MDLTARATAKLQQILQNPEHRSVDGHPQVKTTYGKTFELRRKVGANYRGEYVLARDYGLTAKDVFVGTLSEIADYILADYCAEGACGHYVCTEGQSLDEWDEPEPTDWDYNSEAFGPSVPNDLY